MKNKLQLLAGGIAGLLVPLALVLAYALWGGDSTEVASPVEEPVVEPMPSPALESELATTHHEVAPTPTVTAPEAVEPEPVESYEPHLVTGRDVRVRRLIVATGVARHEPTGAADVFELGGQSRLYAFVDAVNESGDPVELEVTFEPESGESSGHVDLEVPPNVRRWRTWAFTRHVYDTGRWEAVVRGPDGRVLARRPFDVVR